MFDKDSYITALPDRYTPQGLLGKGGMGAVYKAFDSYLKIDVAVKIMYIDAVSPDTLARFQREAKLASKLKHKNIVTIFDFGIMENEVPYMILEFISGKDLEEMLAEQGPLNLSDAMPIFEQICSALIHSHSAGILHRDLKPANTILHNTDSGDLVVKLVDFGIARSTQVEKNPTLTKSGVVIGSPLYMSPEQITSSKIDERSDIYSLGCLMFKTLTGFPPIEGSSILDTLSLKSTKVAPSLQDFSIEADEEFERILARCLESDPTNRFQSVEELKSSLDAYITNSETVDKPRVEQIENENIESKKFYSLKFASLLISLVILFGILVFSLLNSDESFDTKQKSNNTEKKDVVQRYDSSSFLRQTGHSSWTVVEGASHETFEHLSKKSNVDIVSINSVQVSKSDCVLITELPIQKLVLIDIDPLKSAAIKEISKIRTLKELHFTFCKFEDASGFSALHELPQLHRLEIENSGILNESINEAAINYIGAIPALSCLVLKGTKVSAQALKAFPEDKKLKELDLGNIGLRENEFSFLWNLKVDNLSLRQNSISPTFVRKILTRKKLVSINLKGVSYDAHTWERDTIKSVSSQFPLVVIHSSFGDFRNGKRIYD